MAAIQSNAGALPSPSGLLSKQSAEPSVRAVSQYSTTSNLLSLRMRLLSYDTAPEPWYKWLSPRLAVSGSVLEVGSGTGELWRHIDASGASSVTLSDFSDAMCSELRRTEIGNTSVAVKQCDASRLPFADGSFDTLVANHMLYHLDDPEAAVREFSRVLRKGGKLRVALNGRDHIAELLELGRTVGRPSPILDVAKITAETAPALLEKYFDGVQQERFPGEFDVPDPEPVLGYLASWGKEPMFAEQEDGARDIIEKRIAKEGSYKVKKNMVLFTATAR